MSENPTMVIPARMDAPAEPPAEQPADETSRASLTSRLAPPRLASKPTAGVWAGLVVVAVGFGTIFYSWIKVAATLDVGRQMPYVVSGAMTGIGLIVVGIAVVDMAVRRQDRIERRHQLALMRTVLEELRDVVGSQDGDRR